MGESPPRPHKCQIGGGDGELNIEEMGPFHRNRPCLFALSAWKGPLSAWKDPFNPRRAGARRHLRSAGGGRLDAPLLTRLLRIVEENGKKRSKARQKPLRNYFSHFFLLRSKLRPPGAKKAKIFRNFRKSEHCFGKPQLPRDL